MDLIVNNHVIDAPIPLILKTLKSQINSGKLRSIGEIERDNVTITCPVHKDGMERNPSCQVYASRDNDKVEYGYCHCFTCGWSQPLPELVNRCFEATDPEFGIKWLDYHFGNSTNSSVLNLPEINLKKSKIINEGLDESILNKFNYYHPYMWQRKLSKEVVDAFRIGFDPVSNMLTFPVWDENNILRLITYRSVIDKRFHIEVNKDKPVYLLNFIKQQNIKAVYVVESQINALTLWSWGYPAIALLGTGSRSQYNILNKSHIRTYVLCLDGDEAGDKGTIRFKQNMRKDVIISQKLIPRGKDVNDLSKEEFDILQII